MYAAARNTGKPKGFSMLGRWVAILLMVMCALLLLQNKHAAAVGTTYYVSNTGSDTNNDGLSTTSPWKTLGKLSGITFQPGDTIKLKAGDTWDEKLVLNGNGTSGSPITLTSYSTGAKPKISRTKDTSDYGIYGENKSYWTIDGIEVSNAQMLLYLRYSANTLHNGIIIKNSSFHDHSILSTLYAAVKMNVEGITPTGTILNGFDITNNVFDHTSRAVFVGAGSGRYDGLTNLTVSNNQFLNSYPHNTVTIAGTTNGWVQRNLFKTKIGDLSIGTTFLMFKNSDTVEASYNVFDGLDRQGVDPDGSAADYEGGCKNCGFNYNLIKDIDGYAMLYFNTGTLGQLRNTNSNMIGNTIIHSAKDPYSASGKVAIYYQGATGSDTGEVRDNKVVLYPGVTSLYNTANGLTVTNNDVVLLYDDFITETAGATPYLWTVSQAGGTVTAVDQPSALNKSVKLLDNNAGNTVQMSKTFASQTGQVQFEVKMSAEQADQGAAVIFANASGTNAAQIRLDANGQIRYADASGTADLMPYYKNTSYTLKIVADASTDKFDLYVDNVLKASNKSFQTNVSELSMLKITTFVGGTGTFYVDMVEVDN